MTLKKVDEKRGAGVVVRYDYEQSEEVLAYCPQCKALQTIWLSGKTLLPTVKFIQHDQSIYHNCGSNQPCRLYFTR
jgi:hypothetical protein